MTACRNVELPMIYAGISRSERTRRAVVGLTRVGMAHRLDHTPAELSGGECQRVAVARALCLEPSLLLADEPTGNLDSATGDEVMDLFLTINRAGTTILMVTHTMEMAGRASRIARVRDGVILDGGS
jgi:putative ABC transport system ATP-binding protein